MKTLTLAQALARKTTKPTAEEKARAAKIAKLAGWSKNTTLAFVGSKHSPVGLAAWEARLAAKGVKN